MLGIYTTAVIEVFYFHTNVSKAVNFCCNVLRLALIFCCEMFFVLQVHLYSIELFYSKNLLILKSTCQNLSKMIWYNHLCILIVLNILTWANVIQLLVTFVSYDNNRWIYRKLIRIGTFQTPSRLYVELEPLPSITSAGLMH